MNFKVKLKRQKLLLKQKVDLSLLPIQLQTLVIGDYFTRKKCRTTIEFILKGFEAAILLVNTLPLTTNSCKLIPLFMGLLKWKNDKQALYRQLGMILKSSRKKVDAFNHSRNMVFGNLWREIGIYLKPQQVLHWNEAFLFAKDRKQIISFLVRFNFKCCLLIESNLENLWSLKNTPLTEFKIQKDFLDSCLQDAEVLGKECQKLQICTKVVQINFKFPLQVYKL